MEADTNNTEAELLGEGQEAFGGLHGSTKLHAESAQTVFVVGCDAKEEFGVGEELGDLVKLIGVVESHLLDTHILDVSDVRVGLAWLSINDAVRAETKLQNFLNLSLGGTIETSAERGKELDDLNVRVALDGYTCVTPCSCCGPVIKLTVEGSNAREVLLPAEVLAIDFA